MLEANDRCALSDLNMNDNRPVYILQHPQPQYTLCFSIPTLPRICMKLPPNQHGVASAHSSHCLVQQIIRSKSKYVNVKVLMGTQALIIVTEVCARVMKKEV